MYIKKSALIIIICFVVAGAGILAGFIVKAESGANGTRQSVRGAYQQSVANLAEGLANIDYAFQKSLAVNSPQQTVSLAAEIWREAGMAKTSLETLPIYELGLENLMKFFNQSGEYALYLAKKSIGGDTLTDEEKENLTVLSEQAKMLSYAMTELQYQIQTENLSYAELSEFLSYRDEVPEETVTAMSDTGASSDSSETPQAYEYKNPLMKLNSEMQLPELNYDGAYSNHKANTVYNFLKDKNEISEEEARRRAAYILGCEPKDLKAENGSESDSLKLFRFTGRNLDIYITVAEGYPYCFSLTRSVGDISVTDDDAEAKAAECLKKLKFSGMELTETRMSGNVLTASFCYTENGVPCLPDKISVGVALDNGDIISFDASEYLKNHVTGRTTTPSITEAQAAAEINGALTLSGGTLVIVESDSYSEPEKLCYKFVAKTEAGNSVVVYINAVNGMEERVDLLYESDNGSWALS